MLVAKRPKFILSSAQLQLHRKELVTVDDVSILPDVL